MSLPTAGAPGSVFEVVDKDDGVGPGARTVPRRHPLARLLLTRLAGSLLVLGLVTLAVFTFVHAAPGSPERSVAGPYASAETLQQVRETYRLDDPLPVQYLHYLSSLTRADLGDSISTREPVWTVLGRAAAVSVPLLLGAWVLATVVGTALGAFTAHRAGGRLDRTVLGLTVTGASSPAFATGTLLAYVFGVRLGWLPTSGSGDGGVDSFTHLVLPTMTLAVLALAATTKMARLRVGQVLEEDHVTFARARGLPARRLVVDHVLRNAGVQLVTQAGAVLVAMVGALVVVESVFALNGIGAVLVRSISARDIPLIQGVTLVVAVFIVVVNLVADLICLALDPRLRRGVLSVADAR